MTQEILNLYGFHVHIDVILTGAVVNSAAFKLALHKASEERLRRVVADLKWAQAGTDARIAAIERHIDHLVEVAAEVERLREATEAYELTQGKAFWRQWV